MTKEIRCATADNRSMSLYNDRSLLSTAVLTVI